MSDDIKEVKTDVKEIKTAVIDLVKQGAVHNELLKEHERRSLALEAAVSPVAWHSKIFAFLGAVAVVILAEMLLKLLSK